MMEINLPQIAFFALSALALISAIMVITRRNAIHSAIWLIITLFSVAGVFLMLHAEFLFAVQIILYVGGIMVLFLFVIMLVNLDLAAKQSQFSRQWFVAVVTALVLTAELVYGIYLDHRGFLIIPQPPVVAAPNNTQAVAVGLYQTYMLPVEIASLLLLVAMVGAVVMAKRKFE
ncbi:MAG: NADH-quinone oxidoreductase subunit J family protein [Terriglobia bacterium]